MKNIDVILCSDHSLHTIGGAQLSSNIILKGLKESPYSIGVIQPGPNNLQIDKIHYFEIGEDTSIKTVFKNPFKFLKYIKEVRKVLNEEKPEVIHTQAQVNFFIVALLRKLKLISKDPTFIFTERGLFLKYNRLIQLVFRMLINELQILITTTEFNMVFWKSALNDWNIELDEYRVIENTAGDHFEQIDDNYVSPYKNQFALGFVGRWNEVKNWPLAEEISSAANQKLGNNLIVKMAVSCDDEDDEREALAMFERLTNELGDRFQGELNISFDKMDQFYYDIDVYILTTIRNGESFGRTIVEAMSRNTVVMTTDAGGSVEVVNDNDLVLETAEEFAEKLEYFYKNPQVLEEKKANNRLRVKEVYSLENNITKHIQLYNSILKR